MAGSMKQGLAALEKRLAGAKQNKPFKPAKARPTAKMDFPKGKV